MRRVRGLLLPVVLLLAVGAAIGTHLRTEETTPPVPPPVPRRPSPVSVDLHNADLILRHQGRKQMEVRAARISVSRDLRYTTFRGITRAVLYDGEQVAFRLRARQIVLDRHSNDLRVQGPIQITSEQGYHLTAPVALWDAGRQELVFPRGVTMEVSGNTIRAARLVVDLKSQTLLLEGGVEVTFRAWESVP